MEARFELENPEKMEATLTMTMQLENWIELQDQLQKVWPSSELSGVITDVLMQARKTFWAEGKQRRKK